MPYIIGEQKPFPEVQDVKDILTEEWLDLALGAAMIVGSMGAQFSMTKSDMMGNIKKIRAKFDADKDKCTTFLELMQDEIDKKKNKEDKSGTVGGLWLKRGLEYLVEVFWELVREHDDVKKRGVKSESGAVKTACTNAYNISLITYHGMATKMAVKAALMASPYKETLMTKLANGEKDKDDEVIEEMRIYEKALRQYIIMVGKLYNQMGFADVALATSEARQEQAS